MLVKGATGCPPLVFKSLYALSLGQNEIYLHTARVWEQYNHVKSIVGKYCGQSTVIYHTGTIFVSVGLGLTVYQSPTAISHLWLILLSNNPVFNAKTRQCNLVFVVVSRVWPVRCHYNIVEYKTILNTAMKWCHMATEIWVNIGSGNGLLPDGIKPLPEPTLTYHQ